MAGKVHHRQEDQLLAELLHWVMDGEALTTEEERDAYDDALALGEDPDEAVERARAVSGATA